MTQDDEKARVIEIIRRLREIYPDAHCSLDYESPLQLLIATILAAQCTDERVNIVTKTLFPKYPTLEDYAYADPEELAQDIRQTGFYRNKAKNIQAASKMLIEDFGGEIPQTLEELIKLPGVARKTANVVLGNAFGIVVGFVVDTHVTRLSQRLGLTRNTDPVKIERDLMAIVPQKDWLDLSHLFIYHGRAICQARKPFCERCQLLDICPTGAANMAVAEKKVATKR